MSYQNLAAIDLGTNSFHLVVVRADESGNFETIGREKEAVRLGSGAGDLDVITPDAMERGLASLRRFVQIAKSMNAEVRAVGTSALREAHNRSEFLQRVREECGIEVHVVPGIEEARLIYLGILTSVPVFDQKILMMDIGGGSTEYLIGRQGTPEFAISLKLGAIRLKERFFHTEPLSKSQVEACRRYLAVALAPVRDEVDSRGYETAIGSSGTIETIASVITGRDEDDAPAADFTFTTGDLDRAVDLLLSFDTAKKRAKLPGLDDKRADIIVGGAILLQESFRALGITTMRVSRTALREGVIRDILLRRNEGAISSNIRRASITHLSESFHRKGMADASSARRIADLALTLLDGISRILPGLWITPFDNFLLEAAGMLHNIGMVISHSAHHKHSAYIIRNSELLYGLTRHEIELIALLARYHRKAAPSRKHPDFAALSAEDQKRIPLLAGILRIAIGFDRGGSGNVTGAKVEERGGAILIHAVARSGADISLETWAAQMKSQLLADVIGRTITIQAG